MGETVIYQKYQEQLTSNLLCYTNISHGLGEPVNPKLDVFEQRPHGGRERLYSILKITLQIF